jgi:hypothetical protein
MDYLKFKDMCLPLVRSITQTLLLKKHPQISSVKTDQLMNYVHNSFHDADMTGDTAFLSSENLSLGLSKSAESV